MLRLEQLMKEDAEKRAIRDYSKLSVEVPNKFKLKIKADHEHVDTTSLVIGEKAIPVYSINVLNLKLVIVDFLPLRRVHQIIISNEPYKFKKSDVENLFRRSLFYDNLEFSSSYKDSDEKAGFFVQNDENYHRGPRIDHFLVSKSLVRNYVKEQAKRPVPIYARVYAYKRTFNYIYLTEDYEIFMSQFNRGLL